MHHPQKSGSFNGDVDTAEATGFVDPMHATEVIFKSPK
jgi:hypothetical protein